MDFEENENEENLKYETINEIVNYGLEVGHILLRHGMTNVRLFFTQFFVIYLSAKR